MWTAVLGLLLVLGLASAINQARKGRWYTAGGVLLPVLGIDLMLLGSMEQDDRFFWSGVALSLIGFGMEFMAYRRTRASGAGA
ncbi:hypothetical protein OG596_26665 [Streptomyces sp. NBC_01102]|uniref:hypothetical protein n=1 Tax=unclassified Streptomyces TaxID=2593676 RepID=UPI003869C4E0|nr:hypothetical protein OG596_26665 [Streptomyces sp. NBC_01102]